MKHFLKKILIFIIPITILLFSGLFIKPTPRSLGSFLFADIKKDSLLQNTTEPRIIFVGGSNLSFGLNSYEIRDSLKLNPVNTAINVSLGLKYMLQNTLPYLKKGDTVVLAPEYEVYYEDYNVASEELLRTIFDAAPGKIKYLSSGQCIRLLQYVPKFSLTKFDPSEYWGFKESDIYSVNSFNNFGDVQAHWTLPDRPYKPSGLEGDFNTNVISKLKEFEQAATNAGACVYLTFPCMDLASYNISKEKVLQVEEKLRMNNFKLLGNAGKYILPEDMMFNTKYHLNKKGVQYRTKLLIEDFKTARNQNG
ncbi:MAG: hypothetical protein ABJA37_01240 [Ferruginibacter sp.]